MRHDVGRNHPVLIKEAPFLASTIKNIAAPAIRNKATIGGNIAENGFGDTIPAFLVMDACVSLFDGKKVHLKSLSDCIKEELTLTDSIIVSVYLPKKISISKDCYFYKKIGPREAFSPSIVTISGCCLLNENKEVKEIRLAVGGVSTPPQRLVKSEQLIKGSTLSNDLLIKAVQAIKEEFTPNSDAIFSANYKKTVAANLIVSEIARLTE